MQKKCLSKRWCRIFGRGQEVEDDEGDITYPRREVTILVKEK